LLKYKTVIQGAMDLILQKLHFFNAEEEIPENSMNTLSYSGLFHQNRKIPSVNPWGIENESVETQTRVPCDTKVKHCICDTVTFSNKPKYNILSNDIYEIPICFCGDIVSLFSSHPFRNPKRDF